MGKCETFFFNKSEVARITVDIIILTRLNLLDPNNLFKEEKKTKHAREDITETHEKRTLKFIG